MSRDAELSAYAPPAAADAEEPFGVSRLNTA